MVNMHELFFGTGKRTRSLTVGQKKYLFITMAKGKCEYCKKNLVSQGIKENIHHIVEFASRGSDGEHNLIVLCPDCHSRVHNDQISREELRAKIAYRLPKKASGGKAVATTVVTKKAVPKKAVPKKAVVKAPAKKTTPKRAIAEKAATRKATLKKTAVKKATIKKTTPKKATDKKTTARKTTPAKR